MYNLRLTSAISKSYLVLKGMKRKIADSHAIAEELLLSATIAPTAPLLADFDDFDHFFLSGGLCRLSMCLF